MLKFFATACAVLSIGWAESADAATVSIKGQLYAEGNGPAVDPNLQLGDDITFDVEFNAQKAIQLGTTGYFLAQLTNWNAYTATYNLRFATEPNNWLVAGQYYETNCEAEEGPGCSHTDEQLLVFEPAIVYKGDRVVGLIGSSLNYFYAPDWTLGSGISIWSSECKRQAIGLPYICADAPGATILLSDEFYVGPNGHDSTYASQGFQGRWDFANAAISGVPEPTTWALTICGFGLVGLMLRGRQSHVALLR